MYIRHNLQKNSHTITFWANFGKKFCSLWWNMTKSKFAPTFFSHVVRILTTTIGNE